MVRSMVSAGLRRKTDMLDKAGLHAPILEMVTIAIAKKKGFRLSRLLRSARDNLCLYFKRLTAVKHKSVTTPHRKMVENILPTSYCLCHSNRKTSPCQLFAGILYKRRFYYESKARARARNKKAGALTVPASSSSQKREIFPILSEHPATLSTPLPWSPFYSDAFRSFPWYPRTPF